jgi:hypothetical protein
MNKKRPKQITFRASQEEYKIIQTKIKKSGLKQQDFLLNMAMEKEIVFVEGLTELLTEVKRQGNNLNQLTRKLYSNGYIDYKNELPKMEKEWEEVWQLLKSYLQKQV